MERKFKNIIFDLGGVLVDLDKSRCIEAFRKLGYPDVEALVNAYRHKGVFEALEEGSITSEVFCEDIRHDTKQNPDNGQIVDAWNSLLGVIPRFKLEALLKLRQYYMVYLLSNTNVIHWDYACRKLFPYLGFDVNSYFEDVFLSFEMKMAKPDPEIFQAVMTRTGILPGETLMIDDSALNCNTARALGFSVYCPAEDEDWRHLFSEL